jgi:tungstate transport system substrate-binding protein
MKKTFPFLLFILLSSCSSKKKALTILTTTSVFQAGLLEKITQPFEKKYNITIRIIAVGTGQAIRLAKDGMGDLLITHNPKIEEKFIQDGYGVKRFPFAYNHFILVGPKDDPAKVKGLSLLEAFKKIATMKNKKIKFISRGDNSGTHLKEKEFWKKINIKPKPNFYLQSGSGMLQTLLIASEKKAYTLTDEATFVTNKQKLNLVALETDDSKIALNEYSLIPVNPQKIKSANYKTAKQFVKFVFKEAKKIIAKHPGFYLKK